MISNSRQECKITLLIDSLRGGGAERVCVTLANSLKQNGWNVELLVLNLKDAVLQDDLSRDIAIKDLKVNHARTAIFKLAMHLKNSRPTKILVFNYELAILLVILKKILSLQLKIFSRNINTLSQKIADQKSIWHKHIVDILVKLFYRKVDKLIAQSQGMKKDLVKNYAIDEARISVIPNPLSSRIEKVAWKLDFNNVEKEDYLLCVGRLESAKAFHYAIEAFSIVAKHHPTIRLKIVGQGSLENALKDRAQVLGVAGRVDFEGFQNDMVSYYLHARATVLTSLYEGLPNVLIESIALGTPVVAFDCPSGPSEIIVDGENGFLVEHLNVKALADRLIEVVNNNPFDQDTVRVSACKFKSDRIFTQYERVLCV
ncbi:MAG: hypothetical protein A2168_08235 [Planctomycetes bacterium RBG_13_50_24]|nr:MAG: hypothetical protein A2168_08235 [Planctomycetes bacterium RBG_13_50_24]